MKLALGLAAVLFMACGEDAPGPLFEPKPECEGASITPFSGDPQNVISFIEIGDLADGFDLDGDGEPDNKLAAVGSLARAPIQEALDDYSLMIPLEFYDLPAAAEDSCVKFSLYLGLYKTDGDTDGRDTSVEDGDCDDHRNEARPGNPELADNFMDDDCDGLADEVDATPSDDAADRDGDGVTIAAGDCNDNEETVEPGLDEVCGDGLDNDCDGVADRGPDGEHSCNPYDAFPDTIDIDPLSLDSSGDPLIAFNSGDITTVDGRLQLNAGPSVFEVNVPVIEGLNLSLRITGAQIEADVVDAGTAGIHLENGRLAGVLDAQNTDLIRGLSVDEISLTPDASLLDAVFANVLGQLLALPNSKVHHPECKTPDIDVDRDGLEAFCDTDPDDDIKAVDLCVDGDGTEVFDVVRTDGSGNVCDPEDPKSLCPQGESCRDEECVAIDHCTQTLLANGRPMFPDGISVELNFATTGATLREP